MPCSPRRSRRLSRRSEVHEQPMHRNVFYGLSLFTLILDQAVKAWVRAGLPVGGSIALWPGVFHLTHTRNTGMAFSLLEGKTAALVIAALVVIAGIVYAQRRVGEKIPPLLAWSLALPLGGAAGNLLDRLRFGYVTDLFDFRLINFPVFNVADSAITIGIFLLAWRTLTLRDDEVAERDTSSASAASRSEENDDIAARAV